MNAGGNIACASCHPDGEDDGLTWFGADLTPRRTQSLAGGVSARAPYHWAGELESFSALIDEVWVTRMAALRAPTPAQRDTLLAWLDQIPTPRVTEALDADTVERGRVVFEGEGACSQCHNGADFSDHLAHNLEISTGLRTPSLVGVAARAPYLHDGCARTLLDVLGACGGDLHGRKLPASAKADLVEYLRSL
jgi:cytochrome c peroxidase